MPSSTSPSRGVWPRRAAWILGLAAVTLVAAAAYTFWLNPEVQFFKHAIRIKRDWGQMLDKTSDPKVVVCGGSSTAFAIDSNRLLKQHQLAVVNAGLHAGMEPPFLVAFALKLTRPRDTFVLAMESDLITVPFTAPDLAAQTGLAIGEPDLIHARALGGPANTWVEDVISLRPGAYHAFTLAGKILLRKPLYRYAPGDVRTGGWFQTTERREFPPAVPPPPQLSPDARQLFARLVAWGEAHAVKVVYSLPWAYADPDSQDRVRRGNARLLLDILTLMPVLKDPVLGVHPVREHYADTQLHLTEPGAALRSETLATQLREEQFWSREELEALAGVSAVARSPEPQRR